jgi:hypothetical protein
LNFFGFAFFGLGKGVGYRLFFGDSD